jgi:hypothetical protein
VQKLVTAVHTGLWLGLLDTASLDALVERYYTSDATPEATRYREDEYNRGGLFDAEKSFVDEAFHGCNTILVGCAGGGREVLGLARSGYRVEGFECNRGLVEVAQRLLAADGVDARVRFAPANHCPSGDALFDSAIVGWGGYSHVRWRTQRVGFLRDVRAQVCLGAPLLVSFFVRDGRKDYTAVRTVGAFVGRVCGRGGAELGDDLRSGYIHLFTAAEIEDELRAAGFAARSVSTERFGWAVAEAV